MNASATDLDPHALAALLHFYAESGVSELCEDVVIDRFEQSQQILQARNRPQPQAASGPGVSSAQKPGPGSQPAAGAGIDRRTPPPAVAPARQASQLTIPGEAGVRGRPGAGCRRRHDCRTARGA
jgi:hypothetical protein